MSDTLDREIVASRPVAPVKRDRTARKVCAGCRSGAALFPFTMAFQPIVDLALQRIDGHEALVRGPNGEGAGSVLSQVDATNLYAFDQACRVKAIELASRLGMDRQLSINFLPNAVYEPRACIQATLDAARRTGFATDRLTFEILESEDLVDPDHLGRIIQEYRRQGFRIALDDIGTAHSGLLRVAELRPDVVKLDRALIAGCDGDRARTAIIAALVRLCDELGMKLVAEGVEREAEVGALRGAGVRFAQGFHFARPRFEAIAADADIAW